MVKKVIKKGKLIIILFLGFFFLFLSISFLLAQEGRKLEIDYPEIFGLKPEKISDIETYFKYIFYFSVSIIGIILFACLLRGGFLYLTSAGNVGKLKEAKELIFSAFLGAIFLLAGYLILTTINPELAIFFFPKLKIAETKCKSDMDCPEDYVCIREKCIRFPCNTDEDCKKQLGAGFICKENRCVREEEEMTLISYEIPLGQMIEKSLWSETKISNAKTLVEDFEKFLFFDESFSSLGRKLKTLTDECKCEEAKAYCSTPASGGKEIGCGDPCEKVREDIEEIIKKIDEKITKLKDFRERFDKEKNLFVKDEDKFFSYFQELEKCLKEGELITRNEYFARVEFYEKQGWKTQVISTDIPSAGDPLTFYCTKGGRIFDTKWKMLQVPEEVTTPAEKPSEVTKMQPLYCPIIIPVGQLFENVFYETLDVNETLATLIDYIDVLIEKVQELKEKVSECNVKKCEIECTCDVYGFNPCFYMCGRVCACVLPGTQYCLSPAPGGILPQCMIKCKTQVIGQCRAKYPNPPYRGSPCPKDHIEELVGSVEKSTDLPGEIPTLEETIAEFLSELKTSFSSSPYIIETQETPQTPEGKIDLLNTVRKGADFCFNKPEEVEQQVRILVNCSVALGNYGPDDKPIVKCHPNSFFCCSTEEKIKIIKQEAQTLPPETQQAEIYNSPANYQPIPPKPGSYKNYGGANIILGQVIPPANCRDIETRVVRIDFFGKKPPVHQLAKPVFEKVVKEIKNLAANNSKVREYVENSLEDGKWMEEGGWTFVCRTNRNSPKVMSHHSYAIAIDIRPSKNPNCQRAKCGKGPEKQCPSDIPPEIVDIFLKNGFHWGGHYKRMCDAMHFEWMGWRNL